MEWFPFFADTRTNLSEYQGALVVGKQRIPKVGNKNPNNLIAYLLLRGVAGVAEIYS